MHEDKLRKLLDAQDWGTIYVRLNDFARHRARSAEKGRELAQKAITNVYAFDSNWDPEKEPELLKFLMSSVNSLLANERRTAAAKTTVSLEKVRHKAERVRDRSARTPDKLLATQLFERRMTALRARLAEDADALRILDLAVEEIDTPKDIAAATDWPLERVNKARLRMQRHAERVAREIGRDEEEDDEVN